MLYKYFYANFYFSKFFCIIYIKKFYLLQKISWNKDEEAIKFYQIIPNNKIRDNKKKKNASIEKPCSFNSIRLLSLRDK